MINKFKFDKFKFPKRSTIITDNFIFQLHYKFTTNVLLAFTILVTARQYIGVPIKCLQVDKIPGKFIDTYCWVHSTFSVINAWNLKVGDSVPYPGVINMKQADMKNSGVTYHAYYQWVCFVLLLQASLFYLPRYFWKSVINDRIKDVVLTFNKPIISLREKLENLKLLSDYLFQMLKHNGNSYLLSYFLAEALNLINVVGQMFFMNKFLNGYFLEYGTDVVSFSDWDPTVRYDPMIRVFPRLAKCGFHYFGSSGTVTRLDTMCLLPINIVNEKIYIFLWFWFIILSVLTSVVLIYHVLCFICTPLRFLVLRLRAKHADYVQLQIVFSNCHFADWVLFMLLFKNIDDIHINDLVRDLSQQLQKETA